MVFTVQLFPFVFDRYAQVIEVRDLSNSVVKSIEPPVETNEIFYGGTACLILSSPTTVVLYDIQQQKTIGEITSPPVKYVAWSNDSSLVALISKHSTSFYVIKLVFVLIVLMTAITVANKIFSQHSLIHETIRIKSGAWDDTGVFIYSTLNHIKYCLAQGYVSYCFIEALFRS